MIPTPDVPRLLWVPGIGRIVAFTIWLEVDGIARIVFYVLHKQEAYDGTFEGKPLSRTKTPQWPRLVNPPA